MTSSGNIKEKPAQTKVSKKKVKEMTEIKKNETNSTEKKVEPKKKAAASKTTKKTTNKSNTTAKKTTKKPASKTADKKVAKTTAKKDPKKAATPKNKKTRTKKKVNIFENFKKNIKKMQEKRTEDKKKKAELKKIEDAKKATQPKTDKPAKKKRPKQTRFHHIVNVIVTLPILSVIFFYYRILAIPGINKIVRSSISVDINVVLIGLLIFWAIIMGVTYVSKMKHKLIPIIGSGLSIIFTIVMIIGTFYLFQVSSVINNIKDENLFRLDFAVLETRYNSITDLENKSIGVISSSIVKEVNEEARAQIKNNEVSAVFIEYVDYKEMLEALEAGDITAVAIPSDYYNLFSNEESLQEVVKKLRSIHQFEFKVAIEQPDDSKDLTKTPISILLMGVDSGIEGFDSFSRSDVLILTTFNPNTLKVTMTSIPRDSYVEIACREAGFRDKITHTATYSNQCTLDTVQNLFDIELDYYIKVNFKGIVDIVDALDGVFLTSPAEITAQNSDDQRGTFNVYIPEGDFNATGEQALAFARERKQFPDGDIGRGKRQQQVIMAILDKASREMDLAIIQKLLGAAGDNIATNLSTEQITTLGSFLLERVNTLAYPNPTDMFDIQQTHVTGYDNMHYDYEMERILYYYIPYKENVEDLRKMVKNELEIENIMREDSTMYYSIHQMYFPSSLNDKEYNEEKETFTLPDIVPYFSSGKYDYKDVKVWAAERGLALTFTEIREGNPSYNADLEHNTIVDQSVRYQKLVSRLDSINISLIKHNLDCKIADNRKYEECDSIILDFYKAEVDEVKDWNKDYGLKLKFEYIPFDSTKHNKKDVGKIMSQSVKAWSTFAENIDEITFGILETPRVLIPDFTNYVYNEKKSDTLDLDKWIEDNALTKVEIHSKYNDTIPYNHFVSLNYNAGQNIKINQEFEFYISKGPTRLKLVKSQVTINKDKGETYTIAAANAVAKDLDGTVVAAQSADMGKVFGDDEQKGTYEVVYYTVDSNGERYELTQTIVVNISNPTLTITGGNAASGQVGTGFVVPTADAKLETTALTYTITSGGNTYNPGDTFNPTEAGTIEFVYTSAQDANGNTATQTLTLTVAPAAEEASE